MWTSGVGQCGGDAEIIHYLGAAWLSKLGFSEPVKKLGTLNRIKCNFSLRVFKFILNSVYLELKPHYQEETSGTGAMALPFKNLHCLPTFMLGGSQMHKTPTSGGI